MNLVTVDWRTDGNRRAIYCLLIFKLFEFKPFIILLYQNPNQNKQTEQNQVVLTPGFGKHRSTSWVCAMD